MYLIHLKSHHQYRMFCIFGIANQKSLQTPNWWNLLNGYKGTVLLSPFWVLWSLTPTKIRIDLIDITKGYGD